MNKPADLLPPNSTPLERALVNAGNAGVAYPPLVRDALVPERIPAHLLPWMAYNFSIDAWSDVWPLEVKRAAIRNSFRFHQLKGTMAGLRWAARLADTEIIKAVNPPSKLFAAPSLTEEQRRTFLARYPELRIFPFRARGNRGRRGGRFGWLGLYHRNDFCGSIYPLQSGAAARLTPRAQIVDGGIVTELATISREWDWRETKVSQTVEIRRRSTRRYGAFMGSFFRFAPGMGARARIYSVTTEQAIAVPGHEKLALRTVTPSLTPISVVADDVRQRGLRRGMFAGAAFPGGGFNFAHPTGTTARDRIYKRLYLFDPARALERRGRTTHIGASRLGMPPFWSELTVKIRNKRPKRAFGPYVYGFLVKPDNTKYENALRLLRVTKRASTKVLINTKTVRTITAGVSHLAGEVVAGQLEGIA